MNNFNSNIPFEELKKFVKELPDEYAEVTVLHYIENKKPAQIAIELKLSITVTRQRLSKAKFLLRKLSGCKEYEKAYQLIYGRLPMLP